jgi:SAM-dependent methyltransferase
MDEGMAWGASKVECQAIRWGEHLDVGITRDAFKVHDFMNLDSEVMSALKAAGYSEDENGVLRSGNAGYWSNMDKQENEQFTKLLETCSPLEAVQQAIPKFETMMFSPQREAALELLDIKKGEVCIDFGCMWGNLAVGMAKRGGVVLAVDQTLDSLKFLRARTHDENLDNIFCIQDDIRKVSLDGLADVATINGVLEWVPEFGDVELKSFYGKRQARDYPATNPEQVQLDFLSRASRSLRDGGRLLLAIENRFDYSQFLGRPDPHSNLLFTSFLPRRVSNAISMAVLARPYVNYLYSFRKLEHLLLAGGFSKVELHMAFPDYRFPTLILPYDSGISSYRRHWDSKRSMKRQIANWIEFGLMKVLRAKWLAPSILAVATK